MFNFNSLYKSIFFFASCIHCSVWSVQSISFRYNPWYILLSGKCNCTRFHSSFTCGCGNPYSNHEMLVETKDERMARGHPVGQDVPYQAMGGITGFSSLMDGYMRLDPSGVGVYCKHVPLSWDIKVLCTLYLNGWLIDWCFTPNQQYFSLCIPYLNVAVQSKLCL